MAISLFTVWVPTMNDVCQTLSVLIFCVVFWIFVGYLPVIFSIFLHSYNETCSYFIKRKFLVRIGDRYYDLHPPYLFVQTGHRSVMILSFHQIS